MQTLHDDDRDDFPALMGGAALGARLRRLSARIDAEAARAYAVAGVAFEQRWFGVLDQIARQGPMAVSDLAVVLGITHVSVSQTSASLQKAGLLVPTVDERDRRRRTLALTSGGRAFVERLASLWRAFDEASRELDEEAGHVVEALDRLERALARRALSDRIRDRAGAVDGPI